MDFNSLGSFAAHLAGRVEAMRAAEERGLKRVGALVQRDAQRKIGEYQGHSGPFAAWADLADATKADRVRQGYSEDDPGLRSGEMRDSIEHQADHREAHIGSNAEAMVQFELGNSRQPPRSALGAAAFEDTEKIGKILAGSAVSALIGEHFGLLIDHPAGAED